MELCVLWMGVTGMAAFIGGVILGKALRQPSIDLDRDRWSHEVSAAVNMSRTFRKQAS